MVHVMERAGALLMELVQLVARHIVQDTILWQRRRVTVAVAQALAPRIVVPIHVETTRA